MEKMSVFTFAEKLMKENPGITPGEMMHNLHCTGYAYKDCISAVFRFFKSELRQLCSLALAEFKQPLIQKAELADILKALDFPPVEVTNILEELYPKDINNYALALDGKGAYALSNGTYNLGEGDFAVEAWIKPMAGGGTVISRKPKEGGYYNGGFLLVLKPDGVWKLATDDGSGFYEINTEKTSAFDGQYHHVLGLRKASQLEIYFDFIKLNASPRTDRFAGLNINNSQNLAVGYTAQVQEPYNYYKGKIAQMRFWSIAKTYQNKDEWMNTDWIAKGLIGMWTLRGKSGLDLSPIGNALNVEGCVFEEWQI